MNTLFRFPALALLVVLSLEGCPKNSRDVTSLAINPSTVILARGEDVPLVATGVFSDGTTHDVTAEVSWSVDDRFIAEFGGEGGVLRALQDGTTRVRARLGGKETSRFVTVTGARVNRVEVEPARPVVGLDVPLTLTVTALELDGSKHDVTAIAVWSSASPDVATVEGRQLVGHRPGTAVLTVSVDGQPLELTVHVTGATLASLHVEPSPALTTLDLPVPFTAVAVLSDATMVDATRAVSWRSVDPALVAFPGEPGVAVPRRAGETDIEASLGAITARAHLTIRQTALVSLELTPPSQRLAVGTSQRFQLFATFADGSTHEVTGQSTFTSNQTAVARFDGNVLRALFPGSCKVEARFGSMTRERTITVSEATLSSVTVVPGVVSVAAGLTTQASAIGRFSDGSQQDLTAQAIWASGDPTIATVSNATAASGLVTGHATGHTELSATVLAVTGGAMLEVTVGALMGLQVTPSTITMPMGTSTRFEATGLFSDGTRSEVTSQVVWTSSMPAVVTISNGTNHGFAQALSRGRATITAALNGQVARASVVISDATLERLELAPSNASLPSGGERDFHAAGLFSDGSVSDLTRQVNWAVTDPTTALISNAAGTEGRLSAMAPGRTAVIASLGNVAGQVDLTVTSAVLTQLEARPMQLSLALGFGADAVLVGTWSDGSSGDLTSQCMFSSANPRVASVDPDGHVVARALGQTQLEATCGGLTVSIPVVVTAAVLTSLAVTPTTLALANGTGGSLELTGQFSDGTNVDLTSQATWTTANPSVASISNQPGHEGEVTALSVGATQARAQVGSLLVAVPLTVTAATLASLELTPSTALVPLGARQRFTATGRFTDGTTQDLTTIVTWVSSASAVAAISNIVGAEGELTSRSLGSTTISASWNGRSAAAAVTVTTAALEHVSLAPSSPSLAHLTRLRLHAIGVWTDGTTVDLTTTCAWSSLNPTIATISNASGNEGLLSGLIPGSVTVQATCQGQSAQAQVTVTNATLLSIDVSPTNPSAAAGFTAQLSATGHFSDGSSQPFTDFVTWASNDVTLATVSNASGTEGLVSARFAGTLTLTASALSVTQPFVFVVTAAVLQSIDVAPTSSSLALGLSTPLSAIGHFSDGTASDITQQCVWASSVPTIASVTTAGSRGQVQSRALGATTVTATRSGLVASGVVTVTPAVLVALTLTPSPSSVVAGLTTAFTATGTFTDGTTADLTTSVSWAVNDSALASISNSDGTRGIARGIAAGIAVVSASSGPVSRTATLTVFPAQLVSIGVTPSAPSLPRGLTFQLTATGLMTDGTTTDLTTVSTWASLDPSKAPLIGAGLLSAANIGSSVVMVTYGALSTSTSVTVTAAILRDLTLSPNAPSVAAGLSLQLTATGTYSDGTTQNLTGSASWSSSAPGIATLSPGGLVAARGVGSSVVSATQNGITGTTPLTVTAAVLEQLQVTPAAASVPRGLTLQLTATGVFSDASTQDLTSLVSWASANPGVAAISSSGLATTPGIGTTSVSASLGAISGTTPFTVTPAQLTGITLTPGGGTASLGSVRQFTTIGHYTDGTVQNVTAQAAWTSSAPAVAAISNTPGSKGLATTLSTGMTTISASFGGFSAAASLVVIQTTLTRIDVTPAATSTALGYSRQFIAVGTYSDGTTQLLSDVVTWSTSDENIALILNAVGSRGLLSTVAVGTVTVTATLGAVSGSTSHTVGNAVLVFINLTPGGLSLAPSTSASVLATGVFSDGSTQSLTSSVTWSSDDPAVAQVSNAAGSEGTVTGISPGNATISAQLGGVTASLSVVVN